MSVDLHNHTVLCKHANGKNEDYVKEAIKNKIRYFGFSDHAPMNFDKKHRMDLNQMQNYENEVLLLREKYKKKINILLAYEVDFLNGFIEEKVLKADTDYLIGSVHFINQWGFDNPEFIGEYKSRDIDKIWQDYFEEIKALAKSSLFQIVGHIDLIKVFNYLPKKDVKIIAKDAIKEIKKSGMSVEINAAGLRKPVGEIYPSRDIMELLCEYDIPITFSSDAHDPTQVGFKKEELYKYAKDFGYTKCSYYIKKEMHMINF